MLSQPLSQLSVPFSCHLLLHFMYTTRGNGEIIAAKIAMYTNEAHLLALLRIMLLPILLPLTS